MRYPLIEAKWGIARSDSSWVKIWKYLPNPVFTVGIKYVHGDAEQYAAILMRDGQIRRESKDHVTIADARRVAQKMMDAVESGMYESKKLVEGFEEWTYDPVGKDTKHWMLDFYMLNALPDKMGKADKFYRPMSDELSTAIKYAKKSCYDNLKYHLLDASMFAVCAEFRHCYDRNSAADLKEYFKKNGTYKSFFQPYSLYYLKEKNKSGGSQELGHYIPRTAKKEPTAMQPHKEDNAGYVYSYEAVKHSGVSDEQFMIIAEKAFTELSWASSYGGAAWASSYGGAAWASSYGGAAWASIARAWTDLYNTNDNDLDRLSIYIDHIYDLQHNTGTMLNKCKAYYHDGYEWIKRELDFKANVNNLYEFFDKISPDLKAFAAHVIWAKDGTTLESYLKDEGEKEAAKMAAMNKPEPMYQQSAGSIVTSIGDLKVGDKVKILKSGYGFLLSDVGKITTIKEIDKETVKVDTSELYCSDGWKGISYNGKANFEKVGSSTPQGSTPGKFKVGDKVVINNKATKRGQIKWQGKTGVIEEVGGVLKPVAKVKLDDGGKVLNLFTFKLDHIGAEKQDQGFAQTQSGSVIFTKGEKVQYTGKKPQYKGKSGIIYNAKQSKYGKTGQMMIKVAFDDIPGVKTMFVHNLKKMSGDSSAVKGHFVKGDEVVLVQPDESDFQGQGFIWVADMAKHAKLGTKYKVSGIEGPDYIYIKGNGNDWSVKANWIKKVGAGSSQPGGEFTAKKGDEPFDIGDTVECVAKETVTGYHKYGMITLGKHYKVIDVTDTQIEIENDEDQPFKYEFELFKGIEHAPDHPADDFDWQVGDTVKVIETGYGIPSEDRDIVGNIIDTQDGAVKVKLNSKHYGGDHIYSLSPVGAKKCIEKVKVEDMEVSKGSGGFKVGDEVRFKENAGEIPSEKVRWLNGMSACLGKVGTIHGSDFEGKPLYDVDFGGLGKWWLDPAWLEPAEEAYKKPMETEPTESKFEIGDHVKYVANPDQPYYDKVGEVIGYGPNGTITVQLGDGTNITTHSTAFVEATPEESNPDEEEIKATGTKPGTEELPKDLPIKSQEFQIGDQVKNEFIEGLWYIASEEIKKDGTWGYMCKDINGTEEFMRKADITKVE